MAEIRNVKDPYGFYKSLKIEETPAKTNIPLEKEEHEQYVVNQLNDVC